VSFTNSTFLDAFGTGLYTDTQYNLLASGQTSPLNSLFQVGTTTATVTDYTTTRPNSLADGITVGLVLDRMNDPSSLLSGNWAQRQAGIAALSSSGGPWATYGADQATYTATQNAITNLLGNVPASTAASYGYVSNYSDRTIWLTLTPAQFTTLFGQDLQNVSNTATNQFVQAWTGSLSLPVSIASAVKGLWFEESVTITNPAIMDSTLVPPTVGPQGIGNATTNVVAATPAAIAANYKFPLSADIPTDPIALVEGNVNIQATLFADYNLYRQQVGLAPVTPAQFQVVSGTNNTTNTTTSGELTLDISVIAGAAPNSTQLLYSFLGGTPFNAYQQAFFDTAHHAPVLSSSYPVTGQPTASSPFHWAWQQLFVDGALANVSVVMAGGDEGASATFANGIANLANTHSSPFTLIVGGTSIATLASSLSDSTLAQLESLALQDDLGTVFQLVASGLRTLPSNMSSATPGPAGQATPLQALFETVWQTLTVTPSKDNAALLLSPYGGHETGSGGIAITTIPYYQRDYGLSSLTNGHRGAPDVAALSSGDSKYAVLNQSYVESAAGNPLIHSDGGTSAATPLWASLTTQFNAIFHDQGLPSLGFYNDLLYIASVIAPGAFNDVQLGNNDNTYTMSTTGPTGYYNNNTGTNSFFNNGFYMTPTGQGEQATVGYDLVSGLGTPDGTLLVRALTTIAHHQVSFSTSPPLLDSDNHGGWTSGADQILILQATTPGADLGIDVLHGNQILGFASAEPGSYAWTSRLAQQSLQPDFDPALAVLFDKQAQGTATQIHLNNHESLAVSIGGSTAQAVQAALSNDFGFADFFSGNEALRVARPVAIAETVGGQNDQLAVVRLRQVGVDNLSLTLYKVDDFSGKIGNLHPGDAGYQGAIDGRAYLTSSGFASMGGPGYGQFGEALIQHVNAGDLIAMRLTNNTSGAVFLGFTQGNETVGGQQVAHLMNYGSNTWGFEDTWGGGDHDFNDLIVQLDFTSAYGHHWGM
jgi:hypothetical protein